jgi:hypothetical protein
MGRGGFEPSFSSMGETTVSLSHKAFAELIGKTRDVARCVWDLQLLENSKSKQPKSTKWCNIKDKQNQKYSSFS